VPTPAGPTPRQLHPALRQIRSISPTVRFYGISQPSTGKSQMISMKQVLETTPGGSIRRYS
jgi:hypothetical protein